VADQKSTEISVSVQVFGRIRGKMARFLFNRVSFINSVILISLSGSFSLEGRFKVP
jgi:hypothetical protein